MSEEHNRKMESIRRRNALRAARHFGPDGPGALYDIGVGPPHKGEFRHYKNRFPKIELYGCEPNPVLFSKLLPMFQGKLIQTAISDQPEVDLYMECDNHKTFGRSSIHPVKGLASNTLTCSALTLDEFDRQCGQPDNILLWMDIEGSELIALKTGEELLSSGRVRAINLEVRSDTRGHKEWPTAREIRTWLEERGWTLSDKYNNHKTHWDVIYIPAEETQL